MATTTTADGMVSLSCIPRKAASVGERANMDEVEKKCECYWTTTKLNTGISKTGQTQCLNTGPLKRVDNTSHK